MQRTSFCFCFTCSKANNCPLWCGLIHYRSSFQFIKYIKGPFRQSSLDLIWLWFFCSALLKDPDLIFFFLLFFTPIVCALLDTPPLRTQLAVAVVHTHTGGLGYSVRMAMTACFCGFSNWFLDTMLRLSHSRQEEELSCSSRLDNYFPLIPFLPGPISVPNNSLRPSHLSLSVSPSMLFSVPWQRSNRANGSGLTGLKNSSWIWSNVSNIKEVARQKNNIYPGSL